MHRSFITARSRAARHTTSRLLLSTLLVLAAGCAKPDMADFQGANVLYDGEPYGDLVVLAQRVRQCMHSEVQTLPRVILVDRIFQCYTTAGWQRVYGCTGGGKVVMVAKIAEQSQGQLWAHELTHYFGAQTEADPCATLTLDGFSLQRSDAGS